MPVPATKFVMLRATTLRHRGSGTPHPCLSSTNATLDLGTGCQSLLRAKREPGRQGCSGRRRRRNLGWLQSCKHTLRLPSRNAVRIQAVSALGRLKTRRVLFNTRRVPDRPQLPANRESCPRNCPQQKRSGCAEENGLLKGDGGKTMPSRRTCTDKIRHTHFSSWLPRRSRREAPRGKICSWSTFEASAPRRVCQTLRTRPDSVSWSCGRAVVAIGWRPWRTAARARAQYIANFEKEEILLPDKIARTWAGFSHSCCRVVASRSDSWLDLPAPAL